MAGGANRRFIPLGRALTPVSNSPHCLLFPLLSPILRPPPPEATKGIPHFWQTVLLRCDVTRDTMSEKDIDVLRYLTDVQARGVTGVCLGLTARALRDERAGHRLAALPDRRAVARFDRG